jgi:hypothetical protein
MGHHSAAYTLDVYGHLLEERLGPGLDLKAELGVGEERVLAAQAPQRLSGHSGRAGSLGAAEGPTR